MPLSIGSNKIGAILILKLEGTVDGETAGELEHDCAAWISRGEKCIVLDFQHVPYCSSAGLYSVLTSGKKLDVVGGSLLLCGLRGTLKDMFGFVGFDGLFQTFENLDDALAHL